MKKTKQTEAEAKEFVRNTPYKVVAQETPAKYVQREYELRDSNGKVLFKDEGEFPETWSSTAYTIVGTKYFRQVNGKRETSFAQVLDRVVGTIGDYVRCFGFNENMHAQYTTALRLLLEHQYATFNSPVWFNLGISEKPQVSACFINSVEDNMESILDLVKIEGMIFKGGSGSGINISKLRGSGEPLSCGGTASGPIHFMRGLDAMSGAIKSGGSTRRAAKMVLLGIDHPDILDFIETKVVEEDKARALLKAGFKKSFGMDGAGLNDAYISIGFQNANHSVCIPDVFMQRLTSKDHSWSLVRRTDGAVSATVNARELFRKIATAAHKCGDPGIMFIDTVNTYNTVEADGPIRASNPCAEFLFLDNSACNLASINLLKFYDEDTDSFDIELFQEVIRIMLIAQESLVSNAAYPTRKIEHNSIRYRPLGLGFSNLGALLMKMGMSYGDQKSQEFTSWITGTMTAYAYHTSAWMASRLRPFDGYDNNAAIMRSVLTFHLEDAKDLVRPKQCGIDSASPAALFEGALGLGATYGFRNAQVTLLPPTGTTGFMMGCESLGIEPVISHCVTKQLVGGGSLKLTSECAASIMRKWGFADDDIQSLADGKIPDGLSDEQKNVLRTSLGPLTVSPLDHLRIVSSAQKFLSGGISKTVNVPSETTVDEIEELYMTAWKWNIKCLSVYRYGSKAMQPLETKEKVGPAQTAVESTDPIAGPPPAPYRRRLPSERNAFVHKFSIGSHEGYLTAGLYDDGSLGEIFVTMSKAGTIVSGMVDAFATITSIALQYGVPVSVIVDKFSHSRFEPSGYTTNPQIRFAKSIVDYIARYLNIKFGNKESVQVGMKSDQLANAVLDDEPCQRCGTLMLRAGTCYYCPQCGDSSGCS